ncbi:MAG: TetR/AcrR family transcriptional regulator [Porticoccaceae bacterium]|jgi:AcrR family transcriptional regulator|nr:TetR/AcrR family transcriptional regulator [Porticoccaceae bacterium]MEA3301258.1 TetR/AcrR family transcriptional regulator [Pseudomonadota bacterium]HLS97227.1 TetR/AcrR family transcriptional regulator [Porticoccaceae bacterium]
MTMAEDLADFSSISWVDGADWVTTPSQRRSRETLQKILVTARDLFVGQGFEETTIAEISRRSGVSVGSIYNLFADKHSIFLALYEHYRTAREARIAEMVLLPRWQSATAVDVIRFHIEIVFSSSRDDAGFLRLVERRRAVDANFHHTLARAEETFCRAMHGLYSHHGSAFDHSDLETAVRYLHYVIRGSAIWSIMPPEPDDPFFSVESRRYQEETLRMACRYMGCDVPKGEVDSRQ